MQELPDILRGYAGPMYYSTSASMVFRVGNEALGRHIPEFAAITLFPFELLVCTVMYR